MKTIKHSILRSSLGLFAAALAVASLTIGCTDFPSSSMDSIDPGIQGWSHDWGVTQAHQHNSSKVITETKRDTMTAMKINLLQKMAK